MGESLWVRDETESIMNKREWLRNDDRMTRPYTHTPTQTFTYDTLDRLSSAGASGGSGGTYSPQSYTYNSTTGNLASKAGVSLTYGDSAHDHAVTAMGGNTYGYDANGNQTSRTGSGSSYTLTYDQENRLVSVTGAATATFYYDGDGNRVKGAIGGVTTVYIGSHFEWTGSTSTMKKYYYAGATRVVMRTGTSTINYLLGDHLGSTAITTNSSGVKTAEKRYYPWGTDRYTYGSTLTTFKFTGQREESGLGLYFYNARWYDPALARFISADTLVPGPGNPQAYDRYAYTLNNPVRYTDPSGHITCEELGTEECDENGNYVEEYSEYPPVVLYIYEEMMENSQSDLVLLIRLANFLSPNSSGLTKINAWAYWGFMVRTGGPWDHKSNIRQMEESAGRNPDYQSVGDWQYSFDTWSNIHYGFAGSAAGFTSGELLEGAGLEQIGTNIRSGSNIVSEPGIAGFKQFDDPYDQASIKLGIYLWSTYGIQLKPEDFLLVLVNWDGLNRIP